MRFAKTFAIAAIVAASAAGVAQASPYNANVSFDALNDAYFATVLKVNPAEARSLSVDVDVSSLQNQIKNNPFLARTIVDQGFTLDQIVGIDSDTNGAAVTLYAL
ncbi:MAG: hypothetical protein IR164_16305 [Devosia sp.]|uniref:hypothetical protein n=1 Tax=Devosia sp. TaxID=1871048 RepID=UPI0019E01F51|nr:hypothetical protein [Devosia sp.]MBF0680488.1 hypothetical protein [Devosia sp.]